MECDLLNKLDDKLVYVDIKRVKDNMFHIYYDKTTRDYIIYNYEKTKTLDYNVETILDLIEFTILSKYFI